MNDITSAFDSMFNMFLGGFKDCFSILDSITFRGISLLDFMLWILALSIILPLLITLLSSDNNGERVNKVVTKQADKYAKQHKEEYDNMQGG